MIKRTIEEFTVNELFLLYTLVLDRQKGAKADGVDAADSSSQFRMHLLDKLGGLRVAARAAEMSPEIQLVELVAGALFDFAGYLTTRPGEPLRVGETEDAAPICEHLKAWLLARGIDVNKIDADVMGWQDRLGDGVPCAETNTGKRGGQ